MQGALLGGLVIGAAYGYIAQRGSFCLNSGFRFVITHRDYTKVKALGMAIAVQMILLPAVFAMGWAKPSFPAFFPVGAVLGGLLFGAAMYWAAGCAAGVWFKSGAGSMGMLAAVAGMALGATAFEAGPLRGLRDAVHGLGGAVSLNINALGVPLWTVLIPLGATLLLMLMRTQVTSAGAWNWRKTGLLLGLVGVIAWPLSALAGRPFGMAVIGGVVDMVRMTGGGRVASTGFGGWDILFVLGLPLGAYFAARREGAVKLSLPRPNEFVKMIAGGFGLGAGASLAAGCTVGHGLTGVPLLAPGSIVTLAAIATGSALTGFYSRATARNAPQTDCSGRPLPASFGSCGGGSPAVDVSSASTGTGESGMAKTVTIIIQNPPYRGDNKAWHALRFAGASLVEGMSVRVHLLDDGVAVGKRGHSVPEGVVDLEALLKELMEYGLEVRACGLALDGCRLTESEMIEGINRGSMKTLAAWTTTSDLVLTF